MGNRKMRWVEVREEVRVDSNDVRGWESCVKIGDERGSWDLLWDGVRGGKRRWRIMWYL